MKPLIKDLDIIHKALEQNNMAIFLAIDDSILADKNIVIDMMDNFPHHACDIYAFIDEDLQHHKNILEKALPGIAKNIKFQSLPLSLQKDNTLLLQLIEYNPILYDYLPLDTKKNIELNLLCLEKIPHFLAFSIPESIWHDYRFLQKASHIGDYSIFKINALCKIKDENVKKFVIPLFDKNITGEEFSHLVLQKILEAELHDKQYQRKIKI